MASLIALGVTPAKVALVPDSSYYDTALAIASRAAQRLLCSVFIVDVTLTADRGLHVDTLLEHLAAAAWRGADTRLLIGGSRDNVSLAEAADAARARALAHGIPCRWLTSTTVRGSHAKLVVADDMILTGSHNWSPGALSGRHQIQDSVLVDSRDLAALSAMRFEEQWLRAEAAHAAS